MMDANDGLVRRAYDTVCQYEQLGNEVFVADGATFVRNRRYPRRHDANFVAARTTTEITHLGRIAARMEIEFAGYRHRRIHTGPGTPEEFCASLALGDWEIAEQVAMVLEGDLMSTTRVGEIRPVVSGEDWAEYRRLRTLDWKETTGRVDDNSLIDEFVEATRAKMPPAQHWLAWLDGHACAYGSSWPGTSGVGLIEDLFTQPEYRHRGLATSLISHGVESARRGGAGPIVIGARVDDTPKHMYAALGFRPLFLTRHYTRYIES